MSAAKPNCARCGRCAGGKLQERRLAIPVCCSVGCPQPKNLRRIPASDSGHYSSRPANLQRGVALLVVDGFFERKNNQLLAQASDQNRWPIFMIADLNREDLACIEDVDLRCEMARSLFDLSKRPRDFPRWIENGRPIAFPQQSFGPRRQQWVFGFHRLQETTCASKFRAPFRRSKQAFIQSITRPISSARAARCIIPAPHVAILGSVSVQLGIPFSPASRSSSIPPDASRNSLAGTAALEPDGLRRRLSCAGAEVCDRRQL